MDGETGGTGFGAGGTRRPPATGRCGLPLEERSCGARHILASVIPGQREAASFDVQLHTRESKTTIGSMDSGLAPKGAPRNDDERFRRSNLRDAAQALLLMPAGLLRASALQAGSHRQRCSYSSDGPGSVRRSR